MTAIYSPDCACGTVEVRAECTTETFRSELDACRRFLERLRKHASSPRCSPIGDGQGRDPCYWIVHGPGGHVIGVR